jgi:hypothetical protein
MPWLIEIRGKPALRAGKVNKTNRKVRRAERFGEGELLAYAGASRA